MLKIAPSSIGGWRTVELRVRSRTVSSVRPWSMLAFILPLPYSSRLSLLSYDSSLAKPHFPEEQWLLVSHERLLSVQSWWAVLSAPLQKTHRVFHSGSLGQPSCGDAQTLPTLAYSLNTVFGETVKAKIWSRETINPSPHPGLGLAMFVQVSIHLSVLALEKWPRLSKHGEKIKMT